MARSDNMGKLLQFRRPGELDWDSWVEKVKSERSLDRIEALELPPDLAPGKIVPYLVEALNDCDELVRVTAAETLGFFPAPETAPALRNFIPKTEPDSLARAYAYSSLGLVADSIADLIYLASAFSSVEQPNVRVHLMMGLYYAARRLARESIIPMLADETPNVRTLASEALVSLLSTPDDVPQIARAIEMQIADEPLPETREALELAIRLMEEEGYI